MKGLPAGILSPRRILLIGVIAAVVVSACLLGVVGSNADPSDDIQDVASSESGIGGMVMRVVLSLILLIAILYGGMLGMRRFSGRVSTGLLKSGAITVVHKQAIAPKKSIYVVKIGNRAMVIGVTDSQISHLADLSQDDLAGLTVERSGAKPFKHTLLGALGWTGDRR